MDLSLAPADADTGLVFVRTDLEGGPVELPARFDAVSQTLLGTNVSNADGVSVATIEHLMSACAGLGLDNARIEVAGPEIPIMDGSARAFVELIDQAGLKELSADCRRLEIVAPVEYAENDKLARLEPADTPSFSFEIDFPTPVIGRQKYDLELTADNYRAEIGPARTFGFFKDAEALRAAGMALGAGLDNTLVIDEDHLMNEEPLRFPDEFVRHKILDAIGDLSLAGGPILGRFVGRKAGHALNNRLLLKLFAEPSCYRWTSA